MAITLGDGQRTVAALMSDQNAKWSYDRTVRRIKDPALLHIVATGEASDRYSLRVFPLNVTRPARVEITIELPLAAALEVVSATPIAEVTIEIAGASQHAGALATPATIAIPASTRTTARASYVVDQRRSLFAGEAPVQKPVGVYLVDVRDLDTDVDAPRVKRLELRRVVGAHLDELEKCFPGGTVDGRIELRFAVLETGRATAVRRRVRRGKGVHRTARRELELLRARVDRDGRASARAAHCAVTAGTGRPWRPARALPRISRAGNFQRCPRAPRTRA